MLEGRALRARRGGERGTALVETALTLPLFLLLVFGTIDFGRAVYTNNLLANAAREGARFATVDPTNAVCIRSRAVRIAEIANLTPGDVTITLPGSIAIDQPVTVQVATTYQPWTGIVTEAIGLSTIDLEGRATMWIRNVASSPLPCP